MKGVERMKKSNLITGFIYLIAGVILLLIAIFTNTKLDSLLCGFAGVGIGPGLMIIFKYFYWNKPENKKRYQEKSEKEAIELHDELNIKLRDKPGQSIVYRNTIDCPDYFYIRKITRKMLDTSSPLLPLSSCRPWQPK